MSELNRPDPVIVAPDEADEPAADDERFVVTCPPPPWRAVLLGSVPTEAVAGVWRAGVEVVSTDLAGELAAACPFTLLVVAADRFADPDGRREIAALQQLCPSAQLLLCARVDTVDPHLLVAALRAGVDDVLDPGDAAAVDEAIRAALERADSVREHVLAIGAHPDDVEIGCGATLVDHMLRGDAVTVLTMSRGGAGGAADARATESVASAQRLRAGLLVADLPDTRIEADGEAVRLIEDAVALCRPTVVYVHSSHDTHQDHRAVRLAAASATRRVRRVFAYQSPSATNEFAPTTFMPIDAVLDDKLALLAVFDSQAARTYLEPELVVAGARYWARQLGADTRYAEPFEVVRSTGDIRQSAAAPVHHRRLAEILGSTAPTP